MKRMARPAPARFLLARPPHPTRGATGLFSAPSARSLSASLAQKWPVSRGASSVTSSIPCTFLSGAASDFAGGSRRFFVSSTIIHRQARDKVLDAEPVQPNPGQSPPRSELPQQQIDEQFDRVYEKLFNKKRPSRGERDSHDAANPFTQDWRERLFDIMFSNAGSLFMMTVVISLFFQITREQGEHKEYKRLTTARLDDAQHALRMYQAQVHQAADARRQELASALEPTSTAVPPEEVKRLVDQLLTSLVADIDASLTTEESKATTQTGTDSTLPAPVDTNTPASSTPVGSTTAGGHQQAASYHKVV